MGCGMTTGRRCGLGLVLGALIFQIALSVGLPAFESASASTPGDTAISPAAPAGALDSGASRSITTEDAESAVAASPNPRSDTVDIVKGSDIVDVVEVSGYLDGIMADFIADAIGDSAERGSLALVLQVDSSRTTISHDRLIELAELIVESEVPVSMWVGPSGAELTGTGAQLSGLVSDLALAPGSRLGDFGEPVIATDRFPRSLAEAYPRLRDGTVSSGAAIELGFAREAPTLPFFVLDLPGFDYDIDMSGEEPVRVPVTPVRFAKLSLLDQLMHTVASPSVAYLLFLVGAGLLVFELYTAGVGIAGALGALCFVLGCYGLAALPTRLWAVALLLLAMFGYAVDIQTGVPRVWTVIASVCLIAGSLAMFSGVWLSWITLLAGVGGMSLGMVAGMPAMVRTRFGTPTIGREWMIGTAGVARDSVDPEGVVLIDGAPWRARTLRTTPIASGDAVRVVSLDGLILTVEPAEEPQPDQPSAAAESEGSASPDAR